MRWSVLVVLLGAARGKFQPYANNGGSLAAAAGRDFALLAADSQFVRGMTITSLGFEHAVALTETVALGTSGCSADCQALASELLSEAERFAYAARTPMDARAAAQGCSQMMYARRVFPYYASPVVCGLDDDGVGRVYVFDSIGSFAEGHVVAAGSAQAVLQSVLDRLAPPRFPGHGAAVPRFDSADDAKAALLAAFRVAAKKDVTVGDFVDLVLVTRAGTTQETVRIDDAAEAPAPPQQRRGLRPPAPSPTVEV